MTWNFTPFAFLLVIPGLVSVTFVIYFWRRGRLSTAGPIIFLAISSAVWALAHVGEIVGADLFTKLFWAKAQYLGSVFVPVAWLTVGLQYTNRQNWLALRPVMALSIVPVCILVLTWTNDWHGLIWKETYVKEAGPFSVLGVTYGPAFWVWISYSYFLLALGTGCLFAMVVRSPRFYFGQRFVLISLVMIPWIANAFYLQGWGPAFDLTPFAFSLSCVAITYGILRFQLIDIIPIARDLVLENMTDALFVLDMDNRVVDVNPAAGRLFNQPARALMGSPIGEVMGRQPDLSSGIFEEDYVQTELELGTGARTKILAVDISILRENKGVPVGRLMVCRDITKQKRLKEERRDFEAQVQHAQKLESLGVLAGGIAHDFNNLLLGILGNADLALDNAAPDSEDEAYLENVVRSSEQAADLCKQLLAYSGKGKFVIEAIDLSQLIEELSDLLELSLSKKAQLRYELGRDIPAVQADPAQIRQILMNLVINASEALGAENGDIEVCTGVMECDQDYWSTTYFDDGLPGGKYVYVEVSDSGEGMDEASQKRMFDPFYTSKSTGRGLGLAAVVGIIRSHRGAIRVQSEPGVGTTIRVLFPASKNSPEVVSVDDSEFDLSWRGEGMVLVVDDDRVIRTFCKAALETVGLEVIMTEDGYEAVQVYRDRADEIDLVLLDMMMPRMNGIEALEELLKIDENVRVILSSGYSAQESPERNNQNGHRAFLQKPYRSKELLQLVRQTLEAQPAQ